MFNRMSSDSRSQAVPALIIVIALTALTTTVWIDGPSDAQGVGLSTVRATRYLFALPNASSPPRITITRTINPIDEIDRAFSQLPTGQMGFKCPKEMTVAKRETVS